MKLARLEELMQVQQSISLTINEKRVGGTHKVLVDRKEGDYYIGRTEFDSPEVDNEVLIETKKALVQVNLLMLPSQGLNLSIYMERPEI